VLCGASGASAQEPDQPANAQAEPAKRYNRLDFSVDTWAIDTPLAWTRTDCDNDDRNDMAAWGVDDRTNTVNPMNTVQRKVLVLQATWADPLTPSMACSGTLVDNNSLLTAAHCVLDANGVPANNVIACTYGNAQSPAHCFQTLGARPVGPWAATGDMRDDYAMVHLQGLVRSWMPLSNASDAELTADRAYNVGYPGFKPTCTSNFTSPVDPAISFGITPMQANDIVSATPAGLIGTHIDMGRGHSGGPFFNYPAGCCTSEALTGVVSGHRQMLFTSYNGGPKVRDIRNWIIAMAAQN